MPDAIPTHWLTYRQRQAVAERHGLDIVADFEAANLPLAHLTDRDRIQAQRFARGGTVPTNVTRWRVKPEHWPSRTPDLFASPEASL